MEREVAALAWEVRGRLPTAREAAAESQRPEREASRGDRSDRWFSKDPPRQESAAVGRMTGRTRTDADPPQSRGPHRSPRLQGPPHSVTRSGKPRVGLRQSLLRSPRLGPRRRVHPGTPLAQAARGAVDICAHFAPCNAQSLTALVALESNRHRRSPFRKSCRRSLSFQTNPDASGGQRSWTISTKHRSENKLSRLHSSHHAPP